MAFLYFTVFIKTMQREWFNIDRLRLDKFLMLVRKFIGQLLAYLGSHNWDPHLLEQYTDFLRDHLLLPLKPHHAVGLAYHVCDIFVPELRAALVVHPTHNTHSSQHQQQQHQQQEQRLEVGVGKKRGRQVMQEQQQQREAAGALGLPAAALEALLEPFSSTLLRAEEQAMLTRVREAVFDPLIEELLEEDGGQDDDEVSDGDEGREGQVGGGKQRSLPLLVLAGGEGLGASFAAQLFEMGGMPEVKARNRTVLFGISQSLEKAQRKRAKRMLPDTATIPSLASPIVSLPRHQQQQQQQRQQQELRAQEQQQQKQQQQQQQQEQQKGPGSSTKKGKKDKALVFVTDAEEQQAKQHQQQEHLRQEEQDGFPDLGTQQPEPSLASPAAAVSPKTLKKQRKAEAAAAAAAAWGEGGIGSRSAQASPTSVPGTSTQSLKMQRKAEAAAATAIAEGEGGVGSHSAQASSASTPGTSAPGSAKKQGKKWRGDQAASAHASTPAAESTPASSPAAFVSPRSLKNMSIPTAASTPAAAAAAPAAVKAGDFAFSAAGPSGRGAPGGSSPSTPTLGKSAMKKDKKRKAEGAGDDGVDLGAGMDGTDGLVELASVGKPALKSTGAKGRVSIPTGVDDGDGSQQQQLVLKSSGKKLKKQLLQGWADVESLGSPQVGCQGLLGDEVKSFILSSNRISIQHRH
ncbi:nucleolar protein,Nop52-domain-containing protein [Dunaliella salina]|uniref:Nucleolar protein,Nop52-domain-containing protein n=1 Tax=Dunaliella salina TaxID=3046 RepID=A0ABQ7G613_DUNSA|nr:nucleolar protein,Nop52-domain-containing protein [Dunaliella salina]|eukprot:KAF5830019.1 nucleolar protein,Nop52-domain-containing protein [Dunaliella salina]